MSSEETLSRDLRIKASMINLGERIAWGSDTALMDAAADRIDALEAECERLRKQVAALSAQQSAHVSVPSNGRSIFAMILQALDRDAAEGKEARGEMADELRALLNGGEA